MCMKYYGEKLLKKLIVEFIIKNKKRSYVNTKNKILMRIKIIRTTCTD